MSNLPGGVHETRYGEIQPRVDIGKFFNDNGVASRFANHSQNRCLI